VQVAAILGTLQAGFTDFHYLGHAWEDNSKEEALLGISITGIGDRGDYNQFDFRSAAECAKGTNQYFAKEIGINPAARVTCIKPEGTASLVLGTSSGVHGRHAPFYIRRFRFKRNESIINYFATKFPALVVEDKFDSDCFILELPQKSPTRSILRTESAESLLERAKFFHDVWIDGGHVSGKNKHNVSVTVSVKEDEWGFVGEWMWANRNDYNGISLLPHDGGTYVQAPFEDCTEEKYNEMMKHVTEIDLSEVIEEEDHTERVQEAACVGGLCTI
jgi:ribonucleoside-diphosphate reductase alpha chain